MDLHITNNIKHKAINIKKIDRKHSFPLLYVVCYMFYSRSAFTLIELMISLAIVVALLGVTFATYARLQQRQILLGAGATLKNVLRDTQSRAVTGEIDCGVCDCGAPAGQLFSGWLLDISSRQLYGECGTSQFLNKSFQLSSDIIVTPHITPPTRLLFKSFPPGVDQAAIFCLSHPNLTNQFYRIVVNPGGEISGSDGLITTCP